MTSDYTYYDELGNVLAGKEYITPMNALRWVRKKEDRMLQQLHLTDDLDRRWLDVPEMEIVS